MDAKAHKCDIQGEENQLMKELLDDQSPFLLMPKASLAQEDSIVNKLISTVYSGPTLGDIENALSTGFRRTDDGTIDRHMCSKPLVTMMDKGAVSKMDNKYTLRIKSSNGMADDGYKWRKYGQKSIKNSPNPRSYYRCTNLRCNAKKQVERSLEDPEVFIVTYEGLHLHYAYSHLFLPRPMPNYTMPSKHAMKKPKTQLSNQQAIGPSNPPLGPVIEGSIVASSSHPHQDMIFEESSQLAIPEDVTLGPCRSLKSNARRLNPQGLLEDIVPLFVRNPRGDITSFLEDLCFSSQPSSPLSSSSSCLSLSPISPYFDVTIPSSTL